MTTILDGTAFAAEIKAKVKQDTEILGRYGIDVGLALLL
jgi:hypothetical protein